MHRHERAVRGAVTVGVDRASPGGWRGRVTAWYLRFGMRIVLSAFALLIVGAVAMLLLVTRSGYEVACTRDGAARCTLEQCRPWAASFVGMRPAAALDSAAVRVMRPRRGQPRVLLYMYFGREALFAAEFEGPEPELVARQRAAELNRFVADTGQRSVSFEESPPAVLAAASWVGLGVATLLVVVGWRAMRRQERQPGVA